MERLKQKRPACKVRRGMGDLMKTYDNTNKNDAKHLVGTQVQAFISGKWSIPFTLTNISDGEWTPFEFAHNRGVAEIREAITEFEEWFLSQLDVDENLLDKDPAGRYMDSDIDLMLAAFEGGRALGSISNG